MKRTWKISFALRVTLSILLVAAFTLTAVLFLGGGRFWRAAQGEQWYETHSFPGKPSIEIKIGGFPDPSFKAYLIKGKRETKLFDLRSLRIRETNSVKRHYEGKCEVSPGRLQAYEVFWSRNSQRVGISLDGFFIAACDLKAGTNLEPGAGLDVEAFDRLVEGFLKRPD